MAGDWIKMRTVLQTSPKVVRIASALKADRLRTVGGLHAVWCLFDAHSEDGHLSGYTPEVLDEMIGWHGFTRAMEQVSWVIVGHDYLELPGFEAHNGQSAKRRAQEADRKRESRKTSASNADKSVTREEKRREEDNSKELSSEKSPAKVPDPKDTALAEFIYAGVLAVAPKTKKPNLDNWANTIRLMRERDKHSRREIAEVFSWANNDPFWSVNILSPESLRSKFPRLSAKKDSQNENPTGSGNSSSGDGGDRSTVGKASSAAERRRQAILEQDGEDDSS